MSAIDDVIDVLIDEIAAATNAAGITARGATFAGWPTGPQIASVMSDGQYQVSVWPMDGARDATRHRPETVKVNLPNVTLYAVVAGGIITFSGTPAAGFNVHAFVGDGPVDVEYTTGTADTSLAAVAANVAAKINAAAIPGVVATPSGASVAVTNSDKLHVNIGGSGSIIREVGRISRGVQISVWAPTPDIRKAVGNAILGALGTEDNHVLQMPDGTQAGIEYLTDRRSDKAESPYSAFVWHLVYQIEYGRDQQLTATQIEGIRTVTVLNNFAPVTAYNGGV